MRRCPECLENYEDWVEECANCEGVELIEAIEDDSEVEEGSVVSGEEVVLIRSSLSEVQVAQAALEEIGIPARVSDLNTKIMDPFVAFTQAGGALSFDLVVPIEEAERAAQELEGLRRASREARASGEFEVDELPVDLQKIQRLANRIRFAALTVMLAPIALVLAFEYVALASDLEEPPPGHTTTVVAIGLAALEIGLFVILFFVLPSLVGG